MKAEPRQAHIARAGRNIQDFHNISDALDLVVTELARVVVFVEALQPTVAYRSYHIALYRVSVYAASEPPYSCATTALPPFLIQQSPADRKALRGYCLPMGLGRLELPTSRLSGVRSNHLSYRPHNTFRLRCAMFRARTACSCLLFPQLTPL